MKTTPTTPPLPAAPAPARLPPAPRAASTAASRCSRGSAFPPPPAAGAAFAAPRLSGQLPAKIAALTLGVASRGLAGGAAAAPAAPAAALAIFREHEARAGHGRGRRVRSGRKARKMGERIDSALAEPRGRCSRRKRRGCPGRKGGSALATALMLAQLAGGAGRRAPPDQAGGTTAQKGAAPAGPLAAGPPAAAGTAAVGVAGAVPTHSVPVGSVAAGSLPANSVPANSAPFAGPDGSAVPASRGNDGGSRFLRDFGSMGGDLGSAAPIVTVRVHGPGGDGPHAWNITVRPAAEGRDPAVGNGPAATRPRPDLRGELMSYCVYRPPPNRTTRSMSSDAASSNADGEQAPVSPNGSLDSSGTERGFPRVVHETWGLPARGRLSTSSSDEVSGSGAQLLRFVGSTLLPRAGGVFVVPPKELTAISRAHPWGATAGAGVEGVEAKLSFIGPREGDDEGMVQLFKVEVQPPAGAENGAGSRAPGASCVAGSGFAGGARVEQDWLSVHRAVASLNSFLVDHGYTGVVLVPDVGSNLPAFIDACAAASDAAAERYFNAVPHSPPAVGTLVIAAFLLAEVARLRRLRPDTLAEAYSFCRSGAFRMHFLLLAAAANRAGTPLNVPERFKFLLISPEEATDAAAAELRAAKDASQDEGDDDSDGVETAV